MPKRNVSEAATPKDVAAKWKDAGAPLALRLKRASSSLAWYRRALKAEGLKPATRKRYSAQVELYEAMVAALRAERDAEAAKAAPKPDAKSEPKPKASKKAPAPAAPKAEKPAEAKS